jgi:CheY-like chemotaxis protein
VVKEYLTDHSIEALFDRVLIPALVLVRRGMKAGELRAEDEEFVLQATRETVTALAIPAKSDTDADWRGRVLGIPAVGGADEVALDMLRHLARSAGLEIVVAAGGSGLAALAQETTPAAVLVAAVGPGGLTEAGYLCRRLRSQHPGVKIVVGWWGRARDPKKARALLSTAGADRVAATLREARAHLGRLTPVPATLPESVAHEV